VSSRTGLQRVVDLDQGRVLGLDEGDELGRRVLGEPLHGELGDGGRLALEQPAEQQRQAEHDHRQQDSGMTRFETIARVSRSVDRISLAAMRPTKRALTPPPPQLGAVASPERSTSSKKARSRSGASAGLREALHGVVGDEPPR
jgi:hypothetical protein